MKAIQTGGLAGFAAAAVLFSVVGCSSPTGSSTPTPAPAYTTALYMTDTNSGKVYTYNTTTNTSSALPLVTTAKGAAEIKFYKGIGYVAVGYGGVYSFDPSAANPKASVVTGTAALDAQYFAFYGPTKTYVTVSSWSDSTGGVYSFNPSTPTVDTHGEVSGTAGKNFQEVIVGTDGLIYAADNADSLVYRINPANDTVTATFTTSEPGTTGLATGTYNGISGVFVANTGNYVGPGSIDFIANSANTGAASLVTNSSVYPGRLVQLANGNLVATGVDGNSVDHTYLVTLVKTAATVIELKGGSPAASFGGFSLVVSNNLVYIPYGPFGPNLSQLFVFDQSGTQQSFSPAAVMKTGTDCIANVALYQN